VPALVDEIAAMSGAILGGSAPPWRPGYPQPSSQAGEWSPSRGPLDARWTVFSVARRSAAARCCPSLQASSVFVPPTGGPTADVARSAVARCRSQDAVRLVRDPPCSWEC